MEAKASKHASKRVHACARARARCACACACARARPGWPRCPAGAPPRMGANSAAMRAASPKSSTKGEALPADDEYEMTSLHSNRDMVT